jgi:hypothetical protein
MMRKAIFLLCAMGLALGAHAQFTLKVTNIPYPDGQKLYMTLDRIPADSATIQNGTVVFNNSKTTGAANVVVFYPPTEWWHQLWADKDGQIVYDVKANTVSGSQEEAWAEELRPIMEPFAKCSSPDSLALQDKQLIAFADAHPRSFAVLDYIYVQCQANHKHWHYNRYAPIVAHLDTTAFAGTSMWKDWCHVSSYDLSKQPGQPLPCALQGRDVYGTLITSDDPTYKGKYLLININPIHSIDNEATIKDRIRTWKDLHSKGYEEIDYVIDDSKESIIKFFAEHPDIPFAIISDFISFGENDINKTSLGKLRIARAPFYIFVGPDRKIITTSDDEPNVGDGFNFVKQVIYQTLKDKK